MRTQTRNQTQTQTDGSTQSYFTMTEQGKAFGDRLKEQSKATVRVETADALFENAYLLRDDEADIIRIGVCIRTGSLAQSNWLSKGQKWAVLGVRRKAVKSMTVVG